MSLVLDHALWRISSIVCVEKLKAIETLTMQTFGSFGMFVDF